MRIICILFQWEEYIILIRFIHSELNLYTQGAHTYFKNKTWLCIPGYIIAECHSALLGVLPGTCQEFIHALDVVILRENHISIGHISRCRQTFTTVFEIKLTTGRASGHCSIRLEKKLQTEGTIHFWIGRMLILTLRGISAARVVLVYI